MSFARKLIAWNNKQPIRYPWIGERDAYRILLSEFLLQQTRSDQAIGYYHRLLASFPNLADLANAKEDVLLRHWQGLGYYSRARNLHKTVRLIHHERQGRVPQTYDELLQLPGIGPYTAAAIASFAFGERRPVVDGNVYRVLARCYRLETPINTAPAHKQFAQLASDLMKRSNPAAFNQAIMNLGAHVCLPKNPSCNTCPVRAFCESYKHSTQTYYPVKKKPNARKNRYFHYLNFRTKNQTLIEKRTDKDIWQGLFQFPLIETTSERALSSQILSEHLSSTFNLSSWTLLDTSETIRQTLSHQYIHSTFYTISTDQVPQMADSKFILVIRENLRNFALPKTIVQYIESEINYDQ